MYTGASILAGCSIQFDAASLFNCRENDHPIHAMFIDSVVPLKNRCRIFIVCLWTIDLYSDFEGCIILGSCN